MDHFVDVVSVSEIGESRNIKMTEDSNIKREFRHSRYAIVQVASIVRTWAWEQGSNSGTRYQSIIMHDMLV